VWAAVFLESPQRLNAPREHPAPQMFDLFPVVCDDPDLPSRPFPPLPTTRKAKLLEGATKKVKEQAFYMKRAMDQSDLKQVKKRDRGTE
jgi:hypothetical protein